MSQQLNLIARGAIGALKRCNHPFIVADIVHTINEVQGPESQTRPTVLKLIRSMVATNKLNNCLVKGPSGWGWAYFTGSQPVFPENLHPVVEEVEGEKRSSNEWMVEKGWELSSEQLPSGWDSNNFYNSFFVEPVTEEQFLQRWKDSYAPEEGFQLPEQWWGALAKDFCLRIFSDPGMALEPTTHMSWYCCDQPDIEKWLTDVAINYPLKTELAELVDQVCQCQTLGQVVATVYQAIDREAAAAEGDTEDGL